MPMSAPSLIHFEELEQFFYYSVQRRRSELAGKGQGVLTELLNQLLQQQLQRRRQLQQRRCYFRFQMADLFSPAVRRSHPMTRLASIALFSLSLCLCFSPLLLSLTIPLFFSSISLFSVFFSLLHFIKHKGGVLIFCVF